MQHAECVLKNFKWKTNKYYEINNKCYKKSTTLKLFALATLQRKDCHAPRTKVRWSTTFPCSVH